MNNLILRNSKGVEININNSTPFVLQNFDIKNGININTSKGMQQDGVSYLNNNLDSKDITITFTITTENIEELNLLRNKLYNVCSPKLDLGELIYKDDFKEMKIKFICNALPVLEQETGQSYQKCTLNLLCPSPFWEDLEEIKKEIALWLNDLEFPLEVLKEGNIFGHREPNLIVNVINSGDITTGMTIKFRANGTVKNPTLTNINTQKFIKINSTMVAGQEIIVNTNYNNKRVELIENGTISNSFNLIDWESDFLQLEVGDNLFRYNAESGLDNLNVDIYYNNKFWGV